MFDLLCGGKINGYFLNPFVNDEQKIFILLDMVRTFISIRNVWFNQRDNLKKKSGYTT